MKNLAVKKPKTFIATDTQFRQWVSSIQSQIQTIFRDFKFRTWWML